ncbi:hypothetical protein [Aquimarina aquimarini]|uniref:hypothetical protein n=1 Tax=Aquimarina aquimarini TaxID=1191734 RepID=UPI000D54C646|nr:hypothetical protein [Aquimarina aquimarini]
MTLKQKNGMLKLIFFFSSIVLFSISSGCSSSKMYRKHNYHNGVVYYNNFLKISGRFFGDINFYTIGEKEIHTKFLKKNHSIKKNIILYGRAKDPKYEVIITYRENKKIKKSTDTLLLNDFKNQKVIYKKSTKGKEIKLYISAIGSHKSNLTMLRDGDKIIKSFKFNSNIEDQVQLIDIFNTYRYENNFLYLLNKLDQAPINTKQRNQWLNFQLYTTILSNDTSNKRYQELIKKYDSKRTQNLKKITEDVLATISNHPNKKGVLPQIKNVSKHKKVVMLNENHWSPNHRIFAHSLLPILKENGFNYLAIEAVNKDQDSILNERGIPAKSTGYYTREPYFGIFIRKALALGYHIVGYDDDVSNNREKAQAENLIKIIDKDPDAKIFVYAGIDHILEYNPVKKMMAGYFKELSGINPLTIDQVEIIANTNADTILLESKYFNQSELINSGVDYFLINTIKPNLKKVYKENTVFLFSSEEKTLKTYKNEDVLVSVFLEKEYLKLKNNSIPIKNKILSVKDNTIELELPEGNYRLKIMDGNNKVILSKEINHHRSK